LRRLFHPVGEVTTKAQKMLSTIFSACLGVLFAHGFLVLSILG